LAGRRCGLLRGFILGIGRLRLLVSFGNQVVVSACHCECHGHGRHALIPIGLALLLTAILLTGTLPLLATLRSFFCTTPALFECSHLLFTSGLRGGFLVNRLRRRCF